MAKTRAEIEDAIAQKLQDTTKANWGTAELDQAIDAGLDEITDYVPDRAKGTVTFASASKELSVSTLTGLKHIRRLEYPVDKDPRQFRNWEWIDGTTIRVLVDATPSSGDTAYIEYDKVHTLSGTAVNSLATYNLETDFIDLVTARELINKAPKHYNAVNVGSAKALEQLLTAGQRELVDVLFRLRAKRKPHSKRWYPTS